ncbi:LysM peptidoglycan-binding domain-containing protein [Desulfovibrio inopinatus]|uniref:LysM peptidoglycan-binding domain-containing protein n=1 Tax=Desulfovibrio inopinatus TaxID=102109 RepID=UPI00041E19FA|nr:LysM peptidoglycan-binding domain-containing protein [Desulfovibrio inopinatus]
MRKLVASVVFSLFFVVASFSPIAHSIAVSPAYAAQKYTVKKGDTLIEIAKKFHVSVSDLKKANSSIKASKIKIGQKLTIPTQNSSSQSQKSRSGSTYTVRSGDTLTSIGKKFGVKVSDISKANGNIKSKNLKVGQKLTIPTKNSSSQSKKSSSRSTYTVRSGDTLTSIGKKFGVKVSDISKANGNIKSKNLKMGQKLTIPGKAGKTSTPSAPPVETVSYTVQRGDTLSSISRKFNVSITKVRQANRISGNEIMAGQHLKIPGKADRANLSKQATSTSRPAAAEKQQQAPTTTAPTEAPAEKENNVSVAKEKTPSVEKNTPAPPKAAPEKPKQAASKVSKANMTAVDYYAKGNDLGLKKKYDEAIKQFDKAITLDPKNPTYFASRGHAHYYRRNYKKAIVDYTDAIQLDDTFALAYSMRGLSYTRTGNYKQAIGDYDKAIKLNNQEADFYKGRGYAYYHLKQYGPMCQDYEKACKQGDCQLLKTSQEQGLCKTP